jgi:hypothetical protein
MSNNIQKLLPAGHYFIGDPCYVLDDQDWLRFCHYFDTMYEDRDSKINIDPEVYTELNDEWNGAIAGYTAYGDGEYNDVNNEYSYSVDSGMIGAIECSYWEKHYDELEKLGVIVDFEESFLFTAYEGKFYINNVLFLDTNSVEEEEF